MPASRGPQIDLRIKEMRSFTRALVATNYLLGKRGESLVSGIATRDPETLMELRLIRGQLSRGAREQRARALAAEVGRLVRSLRAQRIR